MFTCEDCENWENGCKYGKELEPCEDAYDCADFKDKIGG